MKDKKQYRVETMQSYHPRPQVSGPARLSDHANASRSRPTQWRCPHSIGPDEMLKIHSLFHLFRDIFVNRVAKILNGALSAAQHNGLVVIWR